MTAFVNFFIPEDYRPEKMFLPQQSLNLLKELQH